MIEYVGIILTGSAMVIIIVYLALDKLLTFIWRNDDKVTTDQKKKALRKNYGKKD